MNFGNPKYRKPLRTAANLSRRTVPGGWVVPAGYPAEAYNYREDRLCLNKYIIRQKKYNRCMWATTPELTGGTVVYGDLLVFEKGLPVKPDSLHVVWHDGGYSLRRFVQRADGLELRSPNPDVGPVFVGPDERVESEGVVSFVVKKFANYRNQFGGYPVDAESYIEGGMDYNAYLIDWWESTFYMWAGGDSMLGDNIEDGDLLIVDKRARANIRDNDILVFCLNKEYTLKRHRPGELVPSNPGFMTIPIASGDEGRPWGVLTGVVKKML